MIDLTQTLRSAAQRPLTCLDLTGSFRGIPHLPDDPTQTVQAIAATVRNQNIVERQVWDIVLNHQGRYSKTWKLPLPSDAIHVYVQQLCPLSNGKLAVRGTNNREDWIMFFDREGNCLMQWQPDPCGGIKSVCSLANDRLAVLTNDLRIYLLDDQDDLSDDSSERPNSWQPSVGNTVEGICALSGGNLAVRLVNYTGKSSQIIFLDSQLKRLGSQSRDIDPSVRIVSFGKLLAVVSASVIYTLDEQSSHLQQWMPPVVSGYTTITNQIGQVCALSEDQLAVHTVGSGASIIFLDSQLKCLGEFRPENSGESLNRMVSLGQELGVVFFSQPQQGSDRRGSISCYRVTKSGKYSKVKEFHYQCSSNNQNGSITYCGKTMDVLDVRAEGIIIRESKYGNDSYYIYSATATETTTLYSWTGGATPFIGKLEHQRVGSDGHVFTYSNDEITVSYDYVGIQPANFGNLWEVLAKNRMITECRFAGLPLKDEGARGIAQMMRENTTITQMDLTGTEITDEGARDLLSALKVNSTIIVLLLKGNPIKPSLVEQIECRVGQHARQSQMILVPPSLGPFDIPHELYCSLTHQVMADPVFTDEGETYEREAIEEWFEKHDTCPNTNQTLSSKILIPNKALKKQLCTLHERYPTLLHSGEVYFPKRWQADCLKAVDRGDTESVKRLVDQDARLLVLPLEQTVTLLSRVLSLGPINLLEWVLKKMGSYHLQKLVAETTDGEIRFFKEAAFSLGAEGARCMGQALGWNNGDYEDQLFEAMAEKNLKLADICAAITPLDGLDKQGNTPLHSAVLAEDKLLIELLVRHNAPVKAVNLKGVTPQAMAIAINRADLANYIDIQRRTLKMAPILQPLRDQLDSLHQEIEALRQENQRLAKLTS